MSGLDLGQMIAHGFTSRNATETLTNKTLTAPIINGARSGTAWDIADRASIQPSLDLDFANQRYRVLDGAVGLREIALADILTYTGSGRTYTGARGTLIAQSANAPRITFDPVTGAGLGLSVWGARTNLITYSEQFGNAAWAKYRCTVTENLITAPDGTMTADEMVESSESSTVHYLSFAVSALSGATTLRIWAKSSTRSLGLLAVGGTTQRAAFFNLSAGTSHVEQVGGISPPDLSQSIEAYGGGWYRCSMTWTADGQTSVRITTDGGLFNGNSAGSASMHIWGAQLEAASSASPYIPTTTAAVTAPADVANITGGNFSKWINGTEGTLVCVFRSGPTASATGGYISLAGSASTESIGIRQQSGTLRGVVQVAGADQASLTGPSVVTGNRYAVALSYKANEISMAANGGAVVSDTSATLPTLTQMLVGTLPDGTGHANSTLDRVLYFPRALPSNLQALSA